MIAECADKIAVVLNETASIETRDEALYFVLANALKDRLEKVFCPYEQAVPFAFDDALQDFFLYLRGAGTKTYSMLDSLRDSASADAWLISAFRNFVSHQVRDAARLDITSVPYSPDICYDPNQEMSQITMLSTMIAYCYQELPIVQRFVFLRMVLTILDRNRALPQKDVATVLGMSHVYYRVLGNRVKSFMIQAKERLLHGEELVLAESGLSMQEALESDFTGWYDAIAEYYSMTIAQFAQSESINALRSSYCDDSTGTLLHDTPYTYLNKHTPLENEIENLWNWLFGNRPGSLKYGV